MSVTLVPSIQIYMYVLSLSHVTIWINLVDKATSNQSLLFLDVSLWHSSTPYSNASVIKQNFALCTNFLKRRSIMNHVHGKPFFILVTCYLIFSTLKFWRRISYIFVFTNVVIVMSLPTHQQFACRISAAFHICVVVSPTLWECMKYKTNTFGIFYESKFL